MPRVKRGVTARARHKKVLADIAYHDPEAFTGIVNQVKAKLAA